MSSDVCFVGLFSTGLKGFERRHSDGSPTIFIHSDKSPDVSAVLPYLNELLARDVNNNEEFLYQIKEGTRSGNSSKFYRIHDLVNSRCGTFTPAY